MSLNVLKHGEIAILIQGVRVDNATASASGFVVGPPSPFALCGLGHNLERKLDGGFTYDRGAYVLHDYSELTGHPRIPVEPWGSKNLESQSRAKAGPMIDEIKCHMHVSLLLIGTKNSDADLASSVASQVPAIRFGGGTIVTYDRIIVAADDRQLLNATRRLPRGSVLKGRDDLFANGADDLDAILDAVALVPRNAAAYAQAKERATIKNTRVVYSDYCRNQPGWVVPYAAGFRAVSPLAKRRGHRGDNDPSVTGHVYAEEVVRLAEWVSIRRASQDKFNLCLWKYDVRPDDGVYLTSAV